MIHGEEHIAKVDVTVQIPGVVEFFQQAEQVPYDVQRERQRRHGQQLLAVRLQIAQRVLRTVRFHDFAQDVLQPAPVGVVEVVHLQDAAGQCIRHLPQSAVRLPDPLDVQQGAQRLHLQGVVGHRLTDRHLAGCLFS